MKHIAFPYIALPLLLLILVACGQHQVAVPDDFQEVPNQANIDAGFVKGIVVSGVSKNPETSLYVFVQFRNSDYSLTRSEYFRLDVSFEGE